MKPIRLLGALLITLALTTSTACAATFYGTNDSAATSGQASAPQAALLEAGVGSNSARVTINWSWLQPTNSAPNYGVTDAIYSADIAKGIRPLFVLTGAPSWAWPAGATCAAGATCNYPPGTAYNSAWANIAGGLAARYPKLAGIEVWNEPNMVWNWTGGVDAARYTQLLKLAYTAIKAAAPNTPVIAGALAADIAPTTTSTATPIQQFLQTMYDNGAKGSMDGISIHPYPQATQWWYMDKVISTTEEVRNANHDSVPLWITETGMSVTQFSVAQQTQVDANAIQGLLADPGIAGVYLYTLVEPASGGQGFGLMNSNLTPRSPYCAVAAAMHTSYSCPLTVLSYPATNTQLAAWQAQNLVQAAAEAGLSWYAAHGTYNGLTSAGLHALDVRLSATAPSGTVPPGSGADPSQIGVYQLGTDSVLYCNTSRGDRSYCITTKYRVAWVYGTAAGTLFSAANAVLKQGSQTW